MFLHFLGFVMHETALPAIKQQRTSLFRFLGRTKFDVALLFQGCQARIDDIFAVLLHVKEELFLVFSLMNKEIQF